MPRSFKHLSHDQRVEIKSMLDRGLSTIEIAKYLCVNRGTIYREIQRGDNGDGYDPDYAESRYQANLREKGPERIVLEHPALAQYISDCILIEKLSPERIEERIKADKRFQNSTISKFSIYNAIYDGLIPGVTKETLRSDTAKMFSGGNLIIPTWMREEYGFKDGDIFHIEVTSDKRIILEKQ